MARDDFTKKTKRDLRERVGGKCSKPDCMITTIAPKGNHKLNNIGVAAHICAASKGGVRYDENMTQEQRRSINNGIWLCQNHAKEIDNNEELYTVDLLHEWKHLAEEKAKNALGLRSFTLSELNQSVENAIVSTLTGLPKNTSINSISNTHNAVNSVLGQIDDRFEYETEFTNNTPKVILHPKEDIPFKIIIKNELENSRQQIKQLFEHGKDAKINIKNLEIKGMPLFNGFKEGHLNILSPKKNAVNKVWLEKKETNDFLFLDDFHGKISHGIQSFTFDGSTFCNLIDMTYNFFFDENHKKPSFSMSINYHQWNNKRLIELPFFNKTHKFYKSITENLIFKMNLEIEGNSLLTATADQISEYFYYDYEILQYIKNTITISRLTETEILFDEKYLPTYDDIELMEELIKINKKTEITADRLTSKITTEIGIEDFNIDLITKAHQRKEVLAFKFVNDLQDISIFNQMISLPKKVTDILGVNLVVTSKNIEDIKIGDRVSIELKPTDSFLLIESFE